MHLWSTNNDQLQLPWRKVRSKLNEHIQRHRQQWIAKETVKVWEERREAIYPHPTPPWAGEPVGEGCLQEAKRRVNGRIQYRHKLIEKIEQSMQSALITRHHEHRLVQDKGYAKQAIALKVHHTIERASVLRAKTRKQFQLSQRNIVSYGRKHGIRAAEVMRTRCEQRIKRIERASLSVIRQAFEEHNQPVPAHYQPTWGKSLTKEFNQQI